MINFETEWESTFRQQRLSLVTAVREEIVEWFASMHRFVAIDFQTGYRTRTLKGETKNGETITIEFIEKLGEFDVAIKQNEQLVLWKHALIPSIDYQDTHVTGEEAQTLHTFFYQLYLLVKKTLKT